MDLPPPLLPADRAVSEPRVLIVEDDALSRRALASLLGSRGFRTESARSAEDAIELVDRQGAPDVALVDVDLPGMSGLEFVIHLESTAPEATSVLITASDAERVRSFRRDHGAVGYLRKPVDILRLLGLIEQADGAATSPPPQH
jgi:CheY-like chemotaxis protein